jgi:hypothetical protein
MIYVMLPILVANPVVDVNSIKINGAIIVYVDIAPMPVAIGPAPG